MQRIHFCSGAVFVTGDEIAMALLGYARAVSMVRRSDVIVVPVAARPGAGAAVTLLLTEGSQISAESVEPGGAELLDEGFVRRTNTMAAELLVPPIWDGAEPDFDEQPA